MRPKAQPAARTGPDRAVPTLLLSRFSYRFLPFLRRERSQNGRSGSIKKLKLRKTLHLADTIGRGKCVQENPPPGTKPQNHAAQYIIQLLDCSVLFRISLCPGLCPSRTEDLAP